MWLSRKFRKSSTNESGSVGEVSIEKGITAVVSDTEHRGINFATPGGFRWRPRHGEKVLMISGEENCTYIVGSADVNEENIEPGEIVIFAAQPFGAEIRLMNDGTMRLKGIVEVEGGLFVNGNEIT